jgi:hypothetical protein
MRIYPKNETCFTRDAQKARGKCLRAIFPVYKSLLKKGWSIEQALYFIHNATSSLEFTDMMDFDPNEYVEKSE